MFKKHDLSKLYKLMRRIEANQQIKQQYAELLTVKPSSDKSSDVETTIRDSITVLLDEASNKSHRLSEFCQELKVYQ